MRLQVKRETCFLSWMLWITWNPSLLSVIGEQNWLRNAWLRHRKRSVLKCLQRQRKCTELNEDIGKLLAKAEQLGAEGNVDESQKILMEVEKVRAKKKEAEEEYRNSMPASSFQQQKLRVCEVCSAYLGLHDNDRRLADHFGGKLHLGFIQIREKLDQLRVILSVLILLAVLRIFNIYIKLI
uniref:LUC7 like n=1 Tax=Anas platyrhynchos TaxID=8839 RepID=A0A8B9TYM5_ANAPL